MTRLTIEVGHGGAVSAYDLKCGPPGGSAPDPAGICKALARRPELLVGGPGIWHSCPPGTGGTRVWVRGTYRGYAVDAPFADTTCGWIPGQDDGLGEWLSYMVGAGPGRRESRFAPLRPRRKSTREELRTAEHLRREARRLIRRRQRARQIGMDAAALRVIRDLAQSGALFDGPPLAEVDVYATTRKRGARALGEVPFGPDGPVFVVVYHYAYLDYAGRRHRAHDGGSVAMLDARTLETMEWGAGAPNLRALGSPVTLTF